MTFVGETNLKHYFLIDKLIKTFVQCHEKHFSPNTYTHLNVFFGGSPGPRLGDSSRLVYVSTWSERQVASLRGGLQWRGDGDTTK